MPGTDGSVCAAAEGSCPSSSLGGPHGDNPQKRHSRQPSVVSPSLGHSFIISCWINPGAALQDEQSTVWGWSWLPREFGFLWCLWGGTDGASRKECPSKYLSCRAGRALGGTAGCWGRAARDCGLLSRPRSSSVLSPARLHPTNSRGEAPGAAELSPGWGERGCPQGTVLHPSCPFY